MANGNDPHRGRPVLRAGAESSAAMAAVIMVHGRGADAADILSLSELFAREGVAYLAPEAAGHAWYPNRFFVPRTENEPYLSSALAVVGALVDGLGEKGLAPERVVLLGFSQGACLSLEFAARKPRRYGGVVALSGGLIGAVVRPEDYAGSLAGTPVFLGVSDVDPHIPLARVKESAEVMRRLGGDVTERIYPGMGHTINDDEVGAVGALLDRVLAEAGAG
jgi:predicted esterase